MSARPPAWRTGLLLLLMVGFLAAAGWYGLKALIAPIVPAPLCTPQTVTGTLTSDQVTVNVYNGGTTRGLAASLQTKLKGVGFNVPTAANAPDPVTETTIIGATADAPEVKLVAGFFPDSVTKGDGRADHTVDVMVGDTFGKFDNKAPKQVDIQTAVVCSPTATPTPSPSASASKTPKPSSTPTS